MNLDLKSELDNLFYKYSKSNGLTGEIADRGYVYSETENKKVLFVGINPSFLENDKENKDYSYNANSAVNDYAKHYKPFADLAKDADCENDWTYIDLLYLRETDQKKIDSLLKEPDGINFIIGQLNITFQLIEHLNPQIIVVCNSVAQKFMGANKTPNGDSFENIWLGYEFDFDEKFGVDVITRLNIESIKKGVKHTKLMGVPVLFTSTLTYKNSSDKKRISWQIRNILKYHNIFMGELFNESTNKRNILVCNQTKQLIDMYLRKKEERNNAVKEEKYADAAESRIEEIESLDKILEFLLVVLDKN